jgi:hypothetical protein
MPPLTDFVKFWCRIMSTLVCSGVLSVSFSQQSRCCHFPPNLSLLQLQNPSYSPLTGTSGLPPSSSPSSSPSSLSSQGYISREAIMHANGISANGHTPVALWRHPDARSTRMWSFKDQINTKYGLHLETYDDMYRWSIDHIADFWAETWSFTGVVASKPFDTVRNILLSHVPFIIFSINHRQLDALVTLLSDMEPHLTA